VFILLILPSQQEQQLSSTPIPEIMIRYEGHEYGEGGLERYYWAGRIPLPNYEPLSDSISTINVTKGSIIEFVVSKNITSPTYYEVTVANMMMHPPQSQQDAAIVMDNVRLNSTGKMSFNFEKSLYSVVVTSHWTTVDFYGKHENFVTYVFRIDER
jgi:hypothetical protein